MLMEQDQEHQHGAVMGFLKQKLSGKPFTVVRWKTKSFYMLQT